MLRKILKAGRQQLWLSHREFLHQRHILTYLFWECTLNCNFRCRHCGSRAGEKVFKNELTTTEIKNAFVDVAQNFNAKRITVAVTGGEPLLRKDLFEVMGHANRLGFGWGMVTNGSLVTPRVVTQAKKAGMRTVDVSLDGLEQVHDHFR
ncbi:radical SAM protein, partial [Patescibacteria group bacterium]|nr:radical SAM protein [Patescibacteria group bacterium]